MKWGVVSLSLGDSFKFMGSFAWLPMKMTFGSLFPRVKQNLGILGIFIQIAGEKKTFLSSPLPSLSNPIHTIFF